MKLEKIQFFSNKVGKGYYVIMFFFGTQIGYALTKEGYNVLLKWARDKNIAEVIN